ncbi:SDR family NAD(P)-dependent oxidoreductase [Futiania mangrovi]|uniref:SDR family NAD(P)-dependent oxidoreductase n=1 Tax=Futiania mangrovi TaxID=2959716 RepID=A0A9J6P821_9PROT|nr:SDR family NAD(P)-dependent oxidoreductase [Futiania mangrovii]MCP1335628.1 SDR family NAD(P)-dependent oxidoreductase [Futiania mangrovii]
MTETTAEGPLAGRVALVTGASRGIGRAVTLAYARAGAHVIALARTVGGLEELDDEIQALGYQATLVPLNLKDADGLDRLGASIFERWGRLDVVVGNAAILGTLTPLAHIKPRQWKDLLEINVTANYRLIRSVDPLLRASPSGRAIFVTSRAAGLHRPYWGGYAVTKAALEEMVLTYAAESAKSPVRVNLVDPGPLRTDMRAEAMPGEDPMTLKTPEDIAPLFVELARAEEIRNGEIVRFQPR